ncbi:hypothetical protein D3C85_1572260 [compost metagenome]
MGIVGGRGGEGAGGTLGGGARHRRDEAVAASGHAGDVARAALAVAQHLAQRAHVHAQRGFLRIAVRPGIGDQLGLAHHLAGPLDQRGQDAARTRAQPHGAAGLQQKALRDMQRERTKGDR